ncbi:MAG: FG-GAP-like repeat-containing protein [Planctomycetaceae bacterium]
MFAADVDGDGDLDVLSVSYWDDTIAWYENDGNQVHRTPISTAADGATVCLQLMSMETEIWIS